MPKKLSPRLQQLADMIAESYDSIWDTCCDHGYLGAFLLETQPQAEIHFVDISVEIIESLEEALLKYFPRQTTSPSQQNWHIHARSACDLPLCASVDKQLIIVAGVGGDLALKILQALPTTMPLDVLLCPVHHVFELRSYLADHEWRSVDEKLIAERGRIYEGILVRNHGDNELVSSTGNQIWHSPHASAYLDNLLGHLRRRQAPSPALAAYEQISSALNN